MTDIKAPFPIYINNRFRHYITKEESQNGHQMHMIIHIQDTKTMFIATPLIRDPIVMAVIVAP
jgi:hypothetical protein